MFVNGTISEGWLLGDSGYPLRPWLMKLVLSPTSHADERYIASHIRTMNDVEIASGVLKPRFRCLNSSGGTHFYSPPPQVCKIVVATEVLHNTICAPLPEGRDPHDNGRIRSQDYAGN